jgi:molybdate transport system ATP-binding protein
LSLSKATFRLGDGLVFENTSWIFNRNEHWAIVGPNGSGKSLFGDAVRGRLPLVKGELAYHFKPVTGFTAEECIGHIAFEDRKQTIHEHVVQSRWQSFEQDQAQTVRDILSYERVLDVNPFEISDAHQRERPRFERRCAAAVRLLGIESLLDRKFMVLSNGETQKILLARALCLPLRLLILDEPFTGLDVSSRVHFRNVLQKLMSGPLRILLITADSEALPPGITHMMQVEECRMVQAGPYRKRRSQKLVRTPSTASPYPSKKVRDSVERVFSDCLETQNSKNELVRMRKVTVRYGGVTILQNINWTIRAGESWALLGPNGSGKTTLLSLILGDHPQAYSNDITVLGHRPGAGTSVWDVKQKIGWVSPELHLHFQDSFTCLETVESGFHDTIGLYQNAGRAQRREALRWLKRFALEKSAASSLYELSAGLQRTVLLARALVKRPALLILDEPCQGLDRAHRALFLRTLESLIRAGKETAIYVTHQEQEIPRSIRRVFRLTGAV